MIKHLTSWIVMVIRFCKEFNFSGLRITLIVEFLDADRNTIYTSYFEKVLKNEEI